MNGLSTVVDSLLASPTRSDRRAPYSVTTRTGKLRELLRSGPATSRYLGDQLGLTPTRVSALLANDLRSGKVRYHQGCYELDLDYNEEEAGRIQEAIRLLRQAGYTVSRRAI